MKYNIIKENICATDLVALESKDAIRELVSLISSAGYLPNTISEKKLFEAILKREGAQSTGLGSGFAFPHTRIKGWEGGLVLAIGFSARGIDLSSVDGKPVHVMFLMVSSAEQPYEILQTMSSIAKVLQGLELRTEVDYRKEILKRLSCLTKNSNGIVFASDLMLPVRDCVETETSVEAVAHMMHIKQLDVIPVIDENKRYYGEISCQQIFKLGMPEFFRNLPTVSFVRHIDPFEKYFFVKEDLKAIDIMDKATKPFKKDATLLEVVFELTIKGRQRIFIIGDDGQLEGAIDRFCIIDKILFF